MNKNIIEYQTLVFDCDGVVLNSNKIKTQAFYEATKHFGHEPAQALVDYHVQNGGISRYAKFEYFITQILKQELDESLNQDLLQRFAEAVKNGLMTCEVAEGLDELREKTKHANWLIVSGGDQSELREVFAARGLDKYFNGGIYGSPDTKDEILAREKKQENITGSALFFGDSKYDYQAVQSAELDFVFISDWTEIIDWREWVLANGLSEVESINWLNKLNLIDGVQVYINDKAKIHDELTFRNEGINNKVFLDSNAVLGLLSKPRIEFFGSFNNLCLGSRAKLKRGHVRFGSNNNRIILGNNTTVENAYFLCDDGSKIILGDDCMLSYDLEFRTTDAHQLIDMNSKEVINPPDDILLGDHVWIGKGACIMQGASIASNSIVGTRALVTKVFEQENIALAGVPARIVRENVTWDRPPPRRVPILKCRIIPSNRINEIFSISENSQIFNLEQFRYKFSSNEMLDYEVRKFSYKNNYSEEVEKKRKRLLGEEVFYFKDAIVFGDGGVLTDSNELFLDHVLNKSMYDQVDLIKLAGYELGERLGIALEGEGRCSLDKRMLTHIYSVSEPVILFSRMKDVAYSHFLWDTVPLLIYKEKLELILERKLKLLVPYGREEFASYKLEILRYYGIDEGDLIFKELNEAVSCESLFVGGPLSVNNFHCNKSVAYFLARALKNNNDAGVQKIIYLDRNDYRNGIRSIKNEKEIIEKCKERGGIVVTPGNMSFEEKVEVFGSADIVIAQFGGGLQNHFLFKANTKIIILQSENFFREIIHLTSSFFGHEVYSIEGPVEGNKKSYNADFSINLDEFERILDSIS